MLARYQNNTKVYHFSVDLMSEIVIDDLTDVVRLIRRIVCRT